MWRSSPGRHISDLIRWEGLGMGFYKRDGALIDISVLSDGIEGSDGWVAEVWDLTPGGPGEVMHIRFDSGGRATVDRLVASIDDDFVAWALSVARSELA
ncbi:hypothetical protein [Streptomyces sp. NPDC002386]